MKAVIFDGSEKNTDVLSPLSQEICNTLEQANWTTQFIPLCEKTISPCCGALSCWVRSPGRCLMPGDAQDLAFLEVHNDLMIFLTPIVFGGYSAELKKLADHLIQNVSPHFMNIRGETRRKARYPFYPRFMAVGYQDSPDLESEQIFRALFERNVLNFYPSQSACCVVNGYEMPLAVQNKIRCCLNDVGVAL
ncbi:MAG: NAD(P)H-dependent oxidoreductase [Anaerolineaceae bacterium]|nr:NAD(P)H-dependent oxidoreductase [Anaerolineaceae bacterium]